MPLLLAFSRQLPLLPVPMLQVTAGRSGCGRLPCYRRPFDFENKVLAVLLPDLICELPLQSFTDNGRDLGHQCRRPLPELACPTLREAGANTEALLLTVQP